MCLITWVYSKKVVIFTRLQFCFHFPHWLQNTPIFFIKLLAIPKVKANSLTKGWNRISFIFRTNFDSQPKVAMKYSHAVWSKVCMCVQQKCRFLVVVVVVGFVSIYASSYLKNYCSYIFHNVKSACMHAYICEYANRILCGLMYILTLV